MKRIISIFLLISSMSSLQAHTRDSLDYSTEIGMRGRWQTGTLNQLAINPRAFIKLKTQQNEFEFRADYQYLNVNNITVNSDLWTTALVQLNKKHRLFPSFITRYGFAKSYKIKQNVL